MSDGTKGTILGTPDQDLNKAKGHPLLQLETFMCDFKWPAPGHVSFQTLLELREVALESEIPFQYMETSTADQFGFFLSNKRSWHYSVSLEEALDTAHEHMQNNIRDPFCRGVFFTKLQGHLQYPDIAIAHERTARSHAEQRSIWKEQQVPTLQGLAEVFPGWDWKIEGVFLLGVFQQFRFAACLSGNPLCPLRLSLSKKDAGSGLPIYRYAGEVPLDDKPLDACLAFMGGLVEVADLIQRSAQ